jgi:hypothetical protein
VLIPRRLNYVLLSPIPDPQYPKATAGKPAVRELRSGLEFAFKLWLDNNGLFILSDKLPEEGLRKRLMDKNLDATIKTAIEERR